jgi:hypothetical protein
MLAGAGIVGAAGVVVAAGGGVTHVLAFDAQEKALASDFQSDRVAHYDDRDTMALVAVIAYVGGGVLVAGGGALAGAAFVMGE